MPAFFRVPAICKYSNAALFTNLFRLRFRQQCRRVPSLLPCRSFLRRRSKSLCQAQREQDDAHRDFCFSLQFFQFLVIGRVVCAVCCNFTFLATFSVLCRDSDARRHTSTWALLTKNEFLCHITYVLIKFHQFTSLLPAIHREYAKLGSART